MTLFTRPSVRRHTVGGANRTLNSVEILPRLCSPVGDRRLSPVRPHSIVGLFERQMNCLFC